MPPLLEEETIEPLFPLETTQSDTHDVPCASLEAEYMADESELLDDASASLLDLSLGNSDDGSIATYFAPTDFTTTTWEEAAEYIPPLGFAVVAGGICLLNPLVFLGGVMTAVTAFGAIIIAGGEHDICSCFGHSKKTVDFDMSIVEKEELASKHQPFDAGVTLTSEVEAEPPIDDSIATQDPSSLKTRAQVLAWVKQKFHRLECNNIQGLEFQGLHAQGFFDVFLADNAPFSFVEFQKKRRDKDIVYGKWQDLGETYPSLIETIAQDTKPQSQNPMRERIQTFMAKTNSGIFGPAFANTTKIQRCLIVSKRVLVLENKTILKDIPFGERFYVVERWIVSSEKRRSHPQGDLQYVSKLDITSQVFFRRDCPFEAYILSKAEEMVSEIALQWYAMAQKALERAEQARFARLGHGSHISGAAGASRNVLQEEIEVERVDEMQARVLDGTQTGDRALKVAISPRRRSSLRALRRSLSNAVKRRRNNTEDSIELS